MKWFVLLILTGGLFLAGCQEVEEETDFRPNSKQEQNPDAFSPLTAIDVIESGSSGEIKNVNRFEKFLERVNDQEPDHIQLVQFTTEGDPITRDLQFDGVEFKSKVNSSKDAYGSGCISEAICTEITETETAERIDYQLEGCEMQEVLELLVVWK